MASPLLASTAFAALSHILTRGQNKAGVREDAFAMVLYLTLPVILLLAISLIFVLFYMQSDGLVPDQLKITLEAIECMLGAFLGGISKKLFGVDSSPVKVHRSPQSSVRR